MSNAYKIKVGLRGKLLLSMTGILIGFSSFFTVMNIMMQEGNARQRFLENAHAMSSLLKASSEDSLNSINVDQLRRSLANILRQKEVIYAYVFDETGKILIDGTEDSRFQNKILNDPFHKRSIFERADFVQKDVDRLDITEPIYLSGNKLGRIRIGFSLDRLNQEMIGVRNQNMIMGLSLVLLGILLALILAEYITKPVYELIKKTKFVAKGDFSRRINIASDDEIGALGKSFNKMIADLQAITVSKSEVEKQNELIKKTNKTLAQREQELKSLDKMKMDFVSTVSHELRTPLTVILGNTKLVIQKHESMSDKEKVSFLEVVVEQGEHLLNLINDVLDVAKAESGHLILQRSIVDIEMIVEEAVSFVDVLLKNKGVSLKKEILSQEKEVYVDSLRLRQIFVNLLSNAVKFTPEGEEIIIKVQDYVHSSDVLLVTVSDTGVGIPRNKIDTLFNRFIQVDNSPTRKFGGMGLGLAIIKEIVHLHGGRIWVESEEGEGSTFFFTILKANRHRCVGESLIKEVKRENYG